MPPRDSALVRETCAPAAPTAGNTAPILDAKLERHGEPAAYRRLLREILRDLFHMNRDDVLARIEPELRFRHLTAGTVLFHEKDPADDIYFVLSGRLRAVRSDDRGRALVLGEIGRGETVGELAMITGAPRSATVVAVRASLVAEMSRTTFERVLASRPMTSMAVMRTVVERFREAEGRRKLASGPINVCLLPITAGIDMQDFAARFGALWQEYRGPIRTLSRRESEGGIDAGEQHREADRCGRVVDWLGAAEAQGEALLLVADRGPSGWSERCIQHADEVFLLARADARPALSDVEARLLELARPKPIATQTLVLLHDEHTRSPTGTAGWLARRPVARHIHVRPGLERDMRRLARIAAGRAVGIVLSGGGARGFAHIGVLNALAEAGIEPDFIGGASVGAIIGAFRAADLRGKALVDAARKVFVESGNPTGDYNLLPLVSLLKGGRTRAITERAVWDTAGADIAIEDTWTTYFCVAGNYSNAGEAVLTRGPLGKSVLASYAIPGALPPIIIDGNLFVDGSTVNNLPVDVMERFGVGSVIGVDLLSDHTPTVDLDWMPSTGQLLRDRLRPKAKRRYHVPTLPEMLLNAAVLQSAGRQRDMRERADLCIRPALRGVRLLDWCKYDDVVRSGYECAREQIAALEPALLARLR